MITQNESVDPVSWWFGLVLIVLSIPWFIGVSMIALWIAGVVL